MSGLQSGSASTGLRSSSMRLPIGSLPRTSMWMTARSAFAAISIKHCKRSKTSARSGETFPPEWMHDCVPPAGPLCSDQVRAGACPRQTATTPPKRDSGSCGGSGHPHPSGRDRVGRNGRHQRSCRFARSADVPARNDGGRTPALPQWARETTGDWIIRCLEALGRIVEWDLPTSIVTSVPEGYAYYGLFPEMYIEAAERFWSELRPEG